MRYRKLDANSDMQFGHGSGDFWHDEPEAVGQSVLTRLLLFSGEWFLDTTAGTPWGGFPLNDLVVKQGRILAEHTQLSRDAAIRERIITTSGVLTLTNYGSSFNPESRSFSVNATIDTIYGSSVSLLISTGPPGTPAVMRFAVMPTVSPSRPPPPLLRSLPASTRGR
jgi:hypothetical protein